MKKIAKLSLSRETLRTLDTRNRNPAVASPGFSCVESCYLVTCGSDCVVSTGEKTE